MIPSLSQIALDLNYDGLMIESHINPDEAQSDKDQQLTPDALGELLANLVVRQSSVDDVMFLNLLDELRDRINSIDERILVLVAERMSVAREIGQYKKENNMTILKVERWNDILKTRSQSGEMKELRTEFLIKLWELIHENSIRHQTKIINLKKDKTTK